MNVNTNNRARLLLVAGLSAAGCFTEVAPLVPEPPRVAGVEPERPVMADEPFGLVFDRDVRRGIGAVSVLGPTGAIEAEITVAGARVVFVPVTEWAVPSVQLRLEPGSVEGLEGLPIAAPIVRTVDVVPRARRPDAFLRTPAVELPGPLNLRYVGVELVDVEPSVDLHVQLQTSLGTQELDLDVRTDAAVRALVPVGLELCPEDCSNAQPSLIVASSTTVIATLPVPTSSIADTTPPELIAAKLSYYRGRPELEVCATEPIVLRGELVGEGEVGVGIDPIPLARQRLVPLRSLAPRADYRFVVSMEDIAGNRGMPLEVPFRTPSLAQARLSEVVATPLRDWSDSSGGGRPFDDRPGTGAVTDADEWIEIVNTADEAIDLERAGLEIVTIDATPAVTSVEEAPGLFFGSGGTAGSWGPGEALVVRPRGAMAKRSLVVELRQRDRLLDRWVLGDAVDAEHPGGHPPDVVHESVARTAAAVLRWCRATPGDARPNVSCR